MLLERQGRRFESFHIRSFVNCSFEWHRISPCKGILGLSP